MNIRPDVQALAAYHFRAQPYRVKLDQNESPYDFPPELKALVAEKLLELPFNRYPEMHGESLKAALAAYHDWPAAGIVVSAGSNVLIQALTIACGLGQTVLTVSPTFSVYAMQAQILDAKLVEVPLLEDFALPLEPLLQQLRQGRGVCFLANPAAPTGNLFPEAELITLIESAAEGWTLVLDEAYWQFSGQDGSDLARRYPHVLSLRTFSKAFGLGGIRLGYALCQPALAEQLQKVLLPFSISALQLAIAVIALEHPDYSQHYISSVASERQRIYQALQALEGVSVYPSATNFLLFRVPDAAAFYQGLLQQGVLIRRQDHLPGLHGCLRVSVGTPEENQAFIDAAQQVHAQTMAELSQ